MAELALKGPPVAADESRSTIARATAEALSVPEPARRQHLKCSAGQPKTQAAALAQGARAYTATMAIRNVAP
jgi:hypothetical protein